MTVMLEGKHKCFPWDLNPEERQRWFPPSLCWQVLGGQPHAEGWGERLGQMAVTPEGRRSQAMVTFETRGRPVFTLHWARLRWWLDWLRSAHPAVASAAGLRAAEWAGALCV